VITDDRANVGYVGEILSLFAFIFSSGPVKVWLDMQIGTTSIDKIVEDYEEKRSWASQQMVSFYNRRKQLNKWDMMIDQIYFPKRY